MSPIPDIEQLCYLPLKARFCDCFFSDRITADRKKYWTGWRAGRVLRRNEGKSRPSWWCKSLYRLCHSTAVKDKNSLFLEGLVIRINGHFDLFWHHTIINDSFLSSLPGLSFSLGGNSHTGGVNNKKSVSRYADQKANEIPTLYPALTFLKNCTRLRRSWISIKSHSYLLTATDCPGVLDTTSIRFISFEWSSAFSKRIC